MKDGTSPVGGSTFKTGKSAKSVTKDVTKQVFAIYPNSYPCYTFYDLPGIGDPDIPFSKWSNLFYEALRKEPIGAVCLMVHVDDRVDNSAAVLGIAL